MTTTIQMIPVDLIDPHPHNPRHDIADLGELVKSIKAQGIQQNLLLVPAHDDCRELPADGRHTFKTTPEGLLQCLLCGPVVPVRYRAVIGHRRLAAAKKAGLKEVPAAVAELSDAEQLELMLVENVQRQDLTPIEEAECYQDLLDLDLSTAAIAKTTGRAEKTIQARVKLLTLPEQVRERIHRGQASLLDAAKLEQFADDPEVQAQLAGLLGTANFAVKVASEIERRKQRAAMAELLAALAGGGVTEWEKGAAKGRYIGSVSSPRALEKLTVPDGSVYETVSWSNIVWIYGPPATDAEQAARDERDRAERAARYEADRLAQKDGEVAEKVRGEWIGQLLSGRSTQAQRSAVAKVAVPALAEDPVQQSEWARWFGLRDMDVYNLKKLNAKRAPWLKATEWAWILLVQLHIAAGTNWDDTTRALYVILEELGYQLSDMERARLTPPADQDEDGDDDA